MKPSDAIMAGTNLFARSRQCQQLFLSLFVSCLRRCSAIGVGVGVSHDKDLGAGARGWRWWRRVGCSRHKIFFSSTACALALSPSHAPYPALSKGTEPWLV